MKDKFEKIKVYVKENKAKIIRRSLITAGVVTGYVIISNLGNVDDELMIDVDSEDLDDFDEIVEDDDIEEVNVVVEEEEA